jgi:hypothetical protein
MRASAPLLCCAVLPPGRCCWQRATCAAWPVMSGACSCCSWCVRCVHRLPCARAELASLLLFRHCLQLLVFTAHPYLPLPALTLPVWVQLLREATPGGWPHARLPAWTPAPPCSPPCPCPDHRPLGADRQQPQPARRPAARYARRPHTTGGQPGGQPGQPPCAPGPVTGVLPGERHTQVPTRCCPALLRPCTHPVAGRAAHARACLRSTCACLWLSSGLCWPSDCSFLLPPRLQALLRVMWDLLQRVVIGPPEAAAAGGRLSPSIPSTSALPPYFDTPAVRRCPPRF